MINKATETASEVEQKAKEMAGEVREIGSGSRRPLLEQSRLSCSR